MTNAEVLHQVEHGYRMQIPQGCLPALYDIMLECWHKDPLKRPTFETLQWKLEDFFTMSDSEYRHRVFLVVFGHKMLLFLFHHMFANIC